MFKPNHIQLGTLRRRVVSLMTALTFLVLAVTGILGFARPFSLGIIGLHSLMGFFFIVLIGFHVFNNSRPLKSYVQSKAFWVTIGSTAALTFLFWWQPPPIRALLSLSGNLGPAMERFEIREDGMIFNYAPSTSYKMRLSVKTGKSFDSEPAPQVAIWLENQGAYHIKTLLVPEDAADTPYWRFKHDGWAEAKREADETDGIDAVTSPTPNGSFDPADYILPQSSKESTPYRLLLEINQAGDEQASLVYAVEIDNSLPRTYQLLDLQGYPKQGDDDEKGRATWDLFYVDGSFSTALDLIDSALLTIQR